MNYDIAIIVGIVAVLAQTGAMFYWGGELRQITRDHEQRITRIEREQDRC